MVAGSFTVAGEQDQQEIGDRTAAGPDGKDPASVAALTEVLAAIIERAQAIGESGPGEPSPGESGGKMPCDGLTADGILVIYQELIRWYGEDDPAVGRLLEGVLADEQERPDGAPDFPG